ncbi:c-type cytochrome [Planctomicrobium piriforme]|uniref:40-residue YVTN family beta-propeller repeat-containing protein n=1 Tax=Planctomicrobium piriforme TaxID=1576369 RepID=A0A1I3RHX0_9PLAN|nr:c-type cytochrome [Planctomicrobium piriforme]SFJ46204.1 40-residue YVTN family beta-propeller repeat-containing protein [Planctomicrobium piriforme]
MKRIHQLLRLVAVVLLFAAEGMAGTSNSLMDISTDGTRLACSNRDSGTVSIVDLRTKKKLFEVPVGSHPEGVTFLGNSHRLAVAVYSDDTVKVLDADSGKIERTIEVFDEPYGVVSNPTGTALWVTLEYPGRVIALDPSTGATLQEQAVGRFPRGLALTSAGQLLVTEYFTGIVKAVDATTLQVTDEWAGSAQDNLARQIVAHPTRPKAYLPLQRSMTNVAHGSGSIFPYLSIIDTEAGTGKRRKRVQMDSFNQTYVVANPWEVALSPDGGTLYLVFSGTNDLFVCHVLNDDYHEVEFVEVLRTGANPRAVKVSPDSQTFYVYNALDFTVDAYSTKTLKRQQSIAVTDWTGTPEELLGKKLFYTANPPMSSRRWISCSSCHPDGDSDGRTWQQPEGLRNTQALFGLKETHPIHWSADRDEVQDFEHTIRSPLMQGKGLIRGAVHDSLDAKNSGVSRELDALAAYANSHHFSLSPWAKKGLSPSAQRGKELFFSKETGCATCHSGAYYTDLQRHDVGTGQDDKTELIGPLFDTPTLLGIYRTAPYLHHGRAQTLEEVLTTSKVDDRHGKTSGLTSEQRADLIEYLKALPYEQP